MVKPVLEPECVEMMAHYFEHQSAYAAIADRLAIAKFTPATMAELKDTIGSEAALLVEAVTRLKNFGDANDLANMKRDVVERLQKRGIRLPVGKKPQIGLEKLVSCLSPVLVYFGVPSASSERSRLVVILRLIAQDMGVPGDPRGEVRRLLALKKERENFASEIVMNTLASVLKSKPTPQSF